MSDNVKLVHASCRLIGRASDYDREVRDTLILGETTLMIGDSARFLYTVGNGRNEKDDEFYFSSIDLTDFFTSGLKNMKEYLREYGYPENSCEEYSREDALKSNVGGYYQKQLEMMKAFGTDAMTETPLPLREYRIDEIEIKSIRCSNAVEKDEQGPAAEICFEIRDEDERSEEYVAAVTYRPAANEYEAILSSESVFSALTADGEMNEETVLQRYEAEGQTEFRELLQESQFSEVFRLAELMVSDSMSLFSNLTDMYYSDSAD